MVAALKSGRGSSIAASFADHRPSLPRAFGHRARGHPIEATWPTSSVVPNSIADLPGIKYVPGPQNVVANALSKKVKLDGTFELHGSLRIVQGGGKDDA